MVNALSNKLAHPRLLAAILISVCVAFILPSSIRAVSKTLIIWNVLVWSYLLMMWWLMLHSDHKKVIELANQEDEHGVAILCLLSVAAVASLAAIALELSSAKGAANDRFLYYLFTATTVLGSWCFIGTVFTFHYARMFYQSPAKQRPLNFPDQEQYPNYWDFLYFSFGIALAAQTADISLMSRSMRKVVLFQAILSFIFNAAIIGLSINIAASLIS